MNSNQEKYEQIEALISKINAYLQNHEYLVGKYSSENNYVVIIIPAMCQLIFNVQYGNIEIWHNNENKGVFCQGSAENSIKNYNYLLASLLKVFFIPKNQIQYFYEQT